MLMNPHSITPCSSGRTPTRLSIFNDNPAPMRKSVRVRPLRRDLHLVRRSDHTRPPAAEAFLPLVDQYCAKLKT